MAAEKTKRGPLLFFVLFSYLSNVPLVLLFTTRPNPPIHHHHQYTSTIPSTLVVILRHHVITKTTSNETVTFSAAAPHHMDYLYITRTHVKDPPPATVASVLSRHLHTLSNSTPLLHGAWLVWHDKDARQPIRARKVQQDLRRLVHTRRYSPKLGSFGRKGTPVKRLLYIPVCRMN